MAPAPCRGTTRSGWAVDNFLVQDPHGAPFSEPAQIARIEQAIADALANRSALVPQLAKRPLPHSRAAAFDVRPVVSFDNQASGRFTVIEVNARDRPALLHALAYALFQSKVTIHSSHVATYGERAVDTFYLTDLTGDKLSGTQRLKSLERRLLAAAAGEALTEAAWPAGRGRRWASRESADFSIWRRVSIGARPEHEPPPALARGDGAAGARRARHRI